MGRNYCHPGNGFNHKLVAIFLTLDKKAEPATADRAPMMAGSIQSINAGFMVDVTIGALGLPKSQFSRHQSGDRMSRFY
jgi:hypothetical protein